MVSKIMCLINNLRWVPSGIRNRIAFQIRHIDCGSGFKSHGAIFVRGRGKISIGDDVTINSCLKSNPIGGDTKTILYAKGNGHISIGNNTGISNTAIVSDELVEIGNSVLIGGNCKIYDNDFHSLIFDRRMERPDNDIRRGAVRIKDGAFIGAHSIILKGVTIGEKSVIGAGSVVTKDVPAGEIWGGNPAHFISRVISEGLSGGVSKIIHIMHVPFGKKDFVGGAV